MESVYLETSFISYLVGKPSQDELLAYRQDASKRWWLKRQLDFRLVISEVLYREVAQGDANEAAKRIAVVAPLEVLSLTQSAERLAELFLTKGLLPIQARTDALHLAISACHSVDYLLSWNYRHLVNESIAKRVRKLCESEGYRMPIVLTPEALMGG